MSGEKLRVVLGEDECIAAWAADRIGIRRFAQPLVTIGWEANGEIVGAAVFNYASDFDVHVHLAGWGALTRGSLRAMWNYVFVQSGKRRITAAVREDNKRMLTIMPRVGWVQEGRLRQVFGDADGVVFGMLRNEAPAWMRTDG